MNIQILSRAAIGACALVALPGMALAKPEAPMVGQAVERTAATPGNDNTSAVVPVVLEAQKVNAATSPTQASVPAVTGAGNTEAASAQMAAPASAPTPTPTPATAATIERLTIQAGQRLSVALGAWLKSQSIELSWEPAGTLPGRVRDVVIDSTWLASQTALEPTLTEVLAPFGLTAHVLRQRQTTDASNAVVLDATPTSVVVRNASNARP